MATTNPMEYTYKTAPLPVSKSDFTISGLLTSVFGLAELPSEVSEVSCLWLLHPRLQSQACMEPIASSVIGDWYSRRRESSSKASARGLIAVSFDQRNHGTREIDKVANQAWRGGNEKHAQAMFSIYHGTAVDTSQLIDYISAFAFPDSSHTIVDHMVLGVSLGGHAAWHCLLHDPRITTVIIIIGCPDFTKMMTDRARLSKLKTWTASSPPGSQFLGSKDFPPGLIQAVEKWDPRGFFCGASNLTKINAALPEPSEKEKASLQSLMDKSIGGKRILNLSGGRDKLVPYACGDAFLCWLKNAVAADGWYQGRPVVLDDIIFDEVGHELIPEMVVEAVKFVGESMLSSASGTPGRGRVREFKM